MRSADSTALFERAFVGAIVSGGLLAICTVFSDDALGRVVWPLLGVVVIVVAAVAHARGTLATVLRPTPPRFATLLAVLTPVVLFILYAVYAGLVVAGAVAGMTLSSALIILAVGSGVGALVNLAVLAVNTREIRRTRERA